MQPGQIERTRFLLCIPRPAKSPDPAHMTRRTPARLPAPYRATRDFAHHKSDCHPRQIHHHPRNLPRVTPRSEQPNYRRCLVIGHRVAGEHECDIAGDRGLRKYGDQNGESQHGENAP
jgi:hypothetical protein